MFFFISYNLPETMDVLTVAIEYSLERMSQSRLDLLNHLFDNLNLSGKHLIDAGYISDKPIHNEDVWCRVNLDGSYAKW